MNTGLVLNSNGSVTLCGRGDGKCCPVMEPIRLLDTTKSVI